jgi:HAD superfamily hydrolase (TIGR01490 family)
MNLALFDLDHTLLPLDSDHAFGEFLVSHGWADAAEHGRRNDAFYADYQAGVLDMAAFVDFSTSAWRSRPRAEQDALRSVFMEQVITPALLQPAFELVARHRDRGDLVALVTATNDFVTAPIARALGIAHLLATALERDGEGRVTGRIAGVPNLRDGKVHNVSQWLERQGLDWSDFSDSWCYSDSMNDLPLLERVTRPVATNPGAELHAIAQARGWPILKLFE